MAIRTLPVILSTCLIAACGSSEQEKKQANKGKADAVTTTYQQTVQLPAPYATESVNNFSNVIGWPQNKTPIAPEGYGVAKFAEGLQNPRWIYVAKNGDIFVAESATESGVIKDIKGKLSGKSKSQAQKSSANRITMFRNTNGDGMPDMQSVFLTGLNQPFGMLVIGNQFYVANTDAVVVYPYQYGQTAINAPGKKIINLTASGYNNHWTRNIIANKDSSKIYVSVGSASDAGEHGMENEVRRACIMEFNPDGTGEKMYAGGLRNPMGMDWAPGTHTLWTSVNERDHLGDELVPDYLTSVKEGGFYGWPYAYWGQHPEPRMKEKQRPDLVKKTIVPDISLGAHTASLGLAFDDNKAFSGKYAGGAFIGQHGSWNRSVLSGYMVAFVPFERGKPAGPVQPFLTGFIADTTSQKVFGRPVGVAFSNGGYLLVADDVANTIWCVKPDDNKGIANR